jgi:hypothetical protein
MKLGKDDLFDMMTAADFLGINISHNILEKFGYKDLFRETIVLD